MASKLRGLVQTLLGVLSYASDFFLGFLLASLLDPTNPPLVDSVLLFALLLPFAQYLCIFCGTYFYYFTTRMQK